MAMAVVQGPKVIKGVGSALGALGIGANKKDKERIAKAEDLATRAIAGDTAAANQLYQGSKTWATQVGKDAARKAFEEVQRARPDVAAAVLPTANAQLATVAPALAKAPSALEQELKDLWGDVRARTAQTVGRIGAGATNTATEKIAPAGRAPVNVPFTGTQLAIAGAVLVAVLVGVWLFARRK